MLDADASLHPDLRRLAQMSLVRMTGAAAMTTTVGVYMSTLLDFTPGQIGIVFGSMAFGTAVAAIPAGHLSDRLPLRPVISASILAFGLVTLGITFATSWWLMAVLLFVAGVVNAPVMPVRSVYLTRATSGDDVIHARSVLRSATFTGLAIGTGIGALAFAADTAWAYQLMIATNGVISIVAALGLFVLLEKEERAGASASKTIEPGVGANEPNVGTNAPPAVDPSHADQTPAPTPSANSDAKRRTSLRDWRFFVVTVALAFTGLLTQAVDSVIPVWIAQKSEIPLVVISVLAWVETAIVIVFQPRLASFVTRFRAKSVFTVGLLLNASLIACIGAISSLPKWPATILITLLITVQVFAGLLVMIEIWTLSYSLRKDGQQGAYEGISNAIGGAA